jgi:polyhydroxyalkanoate synthesis regulator phasin
MVNDDKVEEETTDLLDKIDSLKKQIKTFENELGINTEDLRIKWTENDSKVLEKMRESEGQLNVFADLVKNKVKEVNLPEETHQNNIENVPKQVTLGTQTTSEELQAKASELRKKSEQIAEITSMVSRLRKEMLSNPQAQAQPSQAQVPTVQQIKPTQPVHYSTEDIPSLNSMVQRLNELVKENASISTELREMIDETKNVSKANRISELIKKLALAGLNG